MSRRESISLGGVVAIAWPLATLAQQSASESYSDIANFMAVADL
jgi:hypothetical protein